MSNLAHKAKVFVAMSGGVDSSVAALLLKREEYDVTGVHMLCWEGCENSQDKQDAMRVAAKLKIPFLVWDFRKEYKEAVFDYMVQGYATGRTPNPDVMCNREIKFGIFLKKALKEGADFIATGHYARLERKFPISNFQSSDNTENLKSETSLKIAKDLSKDQSYFLCKLTQDQLKHSLFPVGNYLKSEVRKIAKKAGLPVAEKKDSQGLCFVGKIDFQEFLRSLLPAKEGKVVNSRGEILGKHDGSVFLTPGQRHGLNLGGFENPLYVAEKNIATNTVLAAEGEADPVLFKAELNISDINWISVAENFPLSCKARIRYRQPLQNVIIHKLSTANYKLIFDSPQRGVAPGQFAVFYKNEENLGGGVIQ